MTHQVARLGFAICRYRLTVFMLATFLHIRRLTPYSVTAGGVTEPVVGFCKYKVQTDPAGHSISSLKTVFTLPVTVARPLPSAHRPAGIGEVAM